MNAIRAHRARRACWAALLLGALLGPGSASGQPDCLTLWQPVGDPNTQGNLICSTVFDDGAGEKLYVGGSALRSGSTTLGYVGRWNGVAWEALPPPAPAGQIRYLGVHDLGNGPRLYACRQGSGSVIRWTGSAWELVGNATASEAWSLAVFDAGAGPRLFASGFNRVWMLDPNNAWLTVATLSPGNCGPTALAVFDEGAGPRLFLGGFFISLNSSEPNAYGNVARYDGTNWTPVGRLVAGPPWNLCRSGVETLAVFDDGRGPALYAGGFFDVAGEDSAHPSVARWEDGQWYDVGSGPPPVPVTAFSDVWTLRVLDDGRGPALYAAGQFSQFAGLVCNGVARWDGTAWSTLGNGLFASSQVSEQFVLTLAAYPVGGGRRAIIAGGGFGAANGGVSTIKALAQFGAECVCPDFDGDGVVDQDDLDAVLFAFGTAPNAGGDVDGDGFTRQFDLDVVLDRFGRPCP